MNQDCYTSRFGNLESLEGTHELAIAFNGTSSRIHGTFNTTIIFNEHSYQISFKIVEDSNYDLILGTNVLNEFKAIINLKDCFLEIEGCWPISISKKEIDVNEPPMLHVAANVNVPPQSLAYVACTRIGAVSNKATSMCCSGLSSFANNSGLLLANGIINPHSEIFVQVLNLSDRPVLVKQTSKIAALAKCEQIPLSISKSIPTNALKTSTSKPIRLTDLGTD